MGQPLALRAFRFIGQVRLTITTLQGQLAYSEDFLSNQNDLKTLDLADLPKGIYFIRLQTDSGQMIRKLVIE